MADGEMTRRTKIQIAEELVDFLNKRETAFQKQQMIDELGMNAQTASEWLKLYTIFNQGPKIKKIKLPSSVAYQVIKKENQ